MKKKEQQIKLNLRPRIRQKRKKIPNRLFFERQLWDAGYERVAGLDEAGRGCLAGPVVAASVVFKPGTIIPEINDSKQLKPEVREKLFDVIRERAASFSIAQIESHEIDELNILQASLKAMRIAVEAMAETPEYLLIDGREGFSYSLPQKLIVKGDGLSQSIAAASILAKVTRDRLMVQMEKKFPQFSFSKHKGYGTKKHLEEIKAFGILDCHRRSFEPVKSIKERKRI